MAKVTGLRTWRNGEIINARDYVYERNLISTALNTNDDTLINHESRLDVLEPKVATLEGEMDAAQATIIDHENRIDVLEPKVATLESEMNTAQADIDAAEADIDQLEVDVLTKADATTVSNHISNTSNPHSVTKTQVGLSNVDNTSDANKPISTATQTALDLKADLVDGKVPQNQLPSYVDDILEVYIRAGSTEGTSNWLSLTNGGAALTPEAGKIYVIISAGDFLNKTYRWSGSAYSPVGDIALGTTAATAFPGDRGLALEGVVNTANQVDTGVLTWNASTGKFVSANNFVKTSAGNVGIGTSSPATTLSVVGSGANGIQLGISSDTASLSQRLFFTNSTATNTIVREGSALQFRTAATIGSASGTIRMIMNDDGRVGIGTSSLSQKLHVYGTGDTAIQIHQENVNATLLGSKVNDSNFYITNATSAGTLGTADKSITLAATGNVGIGTSSPAERLDVLGVLRSSNASNDRLVFQQADRASAPSLSFAGMGNGSAVIYSVGQGVAVPLAIGTYADTPFILATQNAERIRITGSGNVGIGTTNPLAKFVVSTNNENFEFGTASVTYNGGTIEYINRTSGSTRPDMNFFNSQGAIKFFTGGANERLRITNTGNVGIGTTSPLTRFEVSADNVITQRWSYSPAPSSYNLNVRQTITSGNIKWNFGITNDGTEYNNMLVFDTGKIGIGTSSPGYRLDVAGGDIRTQNGGNVASAGGSINFNAVANALPMAQIKGLLGFNGSPSGVLQDQGDLGFYTRPITGNNESLVERMRIFGSGLVGINETSPSAQLQVKSGATNRVPLIVDTLASHTEILQSWRLNTATRAYIDNNGYLATIGIYNRANSQVGAVYVDGSPKIERNIADTNPALIVNLANASATGNIQVWQKAGVANAWINNTGRVATFGLFNPTNGDNAYIEQTNNGLIVGRNINDSNPALIINLQNASSTGNILNLQSASVTQASIAKDGIANFTGTPSNAQTGDYTLVLADKGKVVRINSSSNLTVTIPLNSTTAFPIDTEIAILRYGTGTVSISPTSGVTLNSKNSERKISGQYGSVALKKIGTDEWVLVGSLEA